MDWEKEEDYEYTNDLSPEGWAWEFLRRNKKYIQSYNNSQLVVNDLENKYGKREDNPHQWAEDPKSKVYIPPKNDNEADQQWKYRVMLNHDNPRIINIESYMAQKWELQRMYDPTEQYEEHIQFKITKDYPRVLDKQGSLDLFTKHDKVNFITSKRVLLFDLYHSIPQQLKIAKKYLKSAQKDKKVKGSFHMDEWSLYLRILDAQFEKATPERIRNFLFKKDKSYDLAKKVRETKYAANKYSDRYLDILHILKLKDKTSTK